MRHEPHQLSILTEFQFAARFPVRFSGWNPDSRVRDGLGRQHDEAALRRCFRQRETDFRLVGNGFSIRCVMHFYAKLTAAFNQFRGIRILEIRHWAAGHVHGFQYREVFGRLRWLSLPVWRGLAECDRAL